MLAAFFAVSTAEASQVAQFTAEPREGVWENPEPYWKGVIGTWHLENIDGTMVVQSEAMNAETGNANTSYFYLDLERAEMYGTDFLVKLRVTDVVPAPHASSAALYVSLTEDAAVGRHPNTLLTISGTPVIVAGHNTSTDFNFRIPSETTEGEPKAEVELASVIPMENGISIRITVDPTTDTAVVVIEGWPETEPIPLRHPWSQARFIRIFQRGLSLAVSSIEAVE